MTPEQALDVLRVMPEPCLVVNGQGDVLGTNAAAATFLQRAAPSLSGVALASLTRDPPARVAAYVGACSRSRSMVLGALTFVGEHGESIRCRCQGAVLRPASATAHALVVLRCTRIERATRDFALLNRQIERLAREVRVRQQVEAERARLYVEAQAASRAKSDFLAVMSHELRTPLNAIAGYAELLEMEVHGPITDAQRDALARLRRSQRRLLSLVNDVLNLARIESGAVAYDIRALVLHDVLSEVEALIAPQVAHRGVRYVYTGVARTVEVQADADRLQQIVLNLLSNAVKFTEPGGTVTLEGEARGEAAAMRVIDTGCGIAPDKLEAIFEPFVQVDTALTRRSEGTGLGLSISRDLARKMGGDLVVESAVGKGTTFTLTLPRPRGVSAPEPLPGTVGAAVPAAQCSGDGRPARPSGRDGRSHNARTHEQR